MLDQRLKQRDLCPMCDNILPVDEGQSEWQLLRDFIWNPGHCNFCGSVLPGHGAVFVCYVIFLCCLPLYSVHAKSQIKESICDYSYKTKRKILDKNITFGGF